MNDAPDAALAEAGPGPGADLRAALEVTFAVHRHLLSAGERVVLDRLRAVSRPALSLVARLLSRQDRLLAVDKLRYAEISDLPAAVAELSAAGLLWRAADAVPLRWLLELHDLSACKAMLRALGLPTSGRREALEARLLGAGEALRPLAVLPAVRLRCRSTLRRWCAYFLLDHEGDLSRLVVDRLGIVRAPTYTPTGGPSLHPCRRAALEAEAARDDHLALIIALGDVGPVEAPPDAAALQGWASRAEARLSPPWTLLSTQRRWSAARWARRSLVRLAAEQEKRGEPAAALALYGRLLAAEPAPALSVRAAMCLERLGRLAEGAALCAAARSGAPLAEALALDRTGARLARAARRGWAPMPPLPSPVERRLKLPLEPVGASGGRPLYRLPPAAPGAPPRTGVVEGVVAAALEGLGRRVLFAENTPWTSIFALIFREELFMPVWGALPGPLLAAPLDLGGADFFAARASALEARLAQVEAGHGPQLLLENGVQYAGEQIRGLSWSAWPLPELAKLCAALGGPALATILRVFALDHRAAGRGLPDLIALPGEGGRLPGLFPGVLPAGLLLIEVKGPRDSLRDEQRAWLHRLQSAGVAAELWWVGPTAEG